MKIFENKEDFAIAICKDCGIVSKMTKQQEKRLEIAWNYYQNAIKNGNCAFWGGACEIMTALPKSNKKHVSKQGKNDIYCYINGTRKGVERKTNGGRIDGITEKTIVVYSMNVHNKTTNVEIPAVIMSGKTFLEILRACNAIRELQHDGIIDGYGVQPSNRPLHKILQNLASGTKWFGLLHDFYCGENYDKTELFGE